MSTERRSRVKVFLVSVAAVVLFWWGLDFWQSFSVYPMSRAVGEGDSERYIVFSAKKWGRNKHEMHGSFTEYWWPGGPKSIEGSFRNGREHGQWTYYDEDGNVVRTEKYADGVKR